MANAVHLQHAPVALRRLFVTLVSNGAIYHDGAACVSAARAVFATPWRPTLLRHLAAEREAHLLIALAGAGADAADADAVRAAHVAQTAAAAYDAHCSTICTRASTTAAFHDARGDFCAAALSRAPSRSRRRRGTQRRRVSHVPRRQHGALGVVKREVER
jgi:hypothetical protein